MNRRNLLCLAVLVMALVLPVACQGRQQTSQDQAVEKVLQTYIETQQLTIRLHSDEYKVFLKDVLLGEHPELVNRDDWLDIEAYALAYLGLTKDSSE